MKSRPNTQLQNLLQPSQWRASLLLLLLMLAITTSEAAVRATLDRDTVYAGDIVTLTIESDARQSNLQPDLAPLEKNFEVLGTSTSTQVSIFNGRRSDKTLWQVQLQPRQSGRLRIPPVTVGKQQTAALELTVTDAPPQTASQPNQHVFIEVEADTAGKHIYVQQQIPYSVRLYYDERLQDGELSGPEPKNAVVEQLGEDRRYSTVRNGRQYNVIERHYVISPEKSGSLYIPPATFRGRIAVPEQRGRSRGPSSMMDQFFKNSPFANDPFFRDNMLNDRFFSNSPFSNPGKPVAIRSRAINIDIKPRPATARQHWLPAEAVTLHDSWTENPPQFRVGEPVSRTITIQTRGLAGSQIPELNIDAPANTRLYPETPNHESRTDGKTIYGSRTQTLTYIPGAQGTLEVPPVTLNWWDTRRNRAASTTLPGWQFKVLPGAGGTASEPPVSHSPAASQNAPAKAAAPTDNSPGSGILDMLKSNKLWLFSGIVLLILILLIVFMARRIKQRRQNDAPGAAAQTSQAAQPPTKPDQKAALQALQKACEDNDRHAAARALLDLACTHWPEDPPRSLGALSTRIEKGRAQINELERSLYAAEAGDWDGAALWDEFRHGLQEKKPPQQTQDDELRPLYPQHS